MADKRRQPLSEGFAVDYLEVQLVDHCNLKCRGCSHFSNLVTEEHFFEASGFEQDLVRLGELGITVRTLRLLGGEPLLHPELAKCIRLARTEQPSTELVVVTNGILLPDLGTDVAVALRECDAIVDVTQYPPTQKHWPWIKAFLDESEIKYRLSPLVKTFRRHMNPKCDSDPGESYDACVLNTCHLLYEGTLSLCPAPVVIRFFNVAFETNYDFSDSILNLYAPGTTVDVVADYLRRPMACCRVCGSPEAFPWRVAGPETARPADWFV